jgi:hypothetical protein
MTLIAASLCFLFYVPRADAVTIEGLALPAPGKGPQVLVGFGRYSVADGRRVSSIRLSVQDTSNPRQWMSVYAEFNAAGEWQSTFTGLPDECFCWVEMTTTDEPGDPRNSRTGQLTVTDCTLLRLK